MGNNPILGNTEGDLSSEAVRVLSQRLPADWRLTPAKRGKKSSFPDYLARIKAPDGTSTLIGIEVKTRLEPRDVPLLENAVRRRRSEKADFTPIVVARFLSPRTRELLRKAGISYVDLSGNSWVVTRRPAMFVETVGAEQNPRPEYRRERSLKGPKAGRIVRALCDFQPPIGVRELAARAEVDPSYVARVLAFLTKQAIVERSPQGALINVDWRALIREWAKEYRRFMPKTALASPLGAKQVYLYLEPRGLPKFLDSLRGLPEQYSLTGSMAAAKVAPVAPSRFAVCYLNDPEKTADFLQLRPEMSSSNVILARPFDAIVYKRTWTKEGITYCALSQVAADLLTSPGRGPAEADALMDWMAQNEDAWRT